MTLRCVTELFALYFAADPGSQTPLVLVACGSFSPPTFLHLRMAEQARDYAHLNSDFEVVGGFLSPVGDAYKVRISGFRGLNKC